MSRSRSSSHDDDELLVLERPSFFKRNPWFKWLLIGLAIAAVAAAVGVAIAFTMGAATPAVVAVGALVAAKVATTTTLFSLPLIIGLSLGGALLAGLGIFAVCRCCRRPGYTSTYTPVDTYAVGATRVGPPPVYYHTHHTHHSSGPGFYGTYSSGATRANSGYSSSSAPASTGGYGSSSSGGGYGSSASSGGGGYGSSAGGGGAPSSYSSFTRN